MRKKDDTLRDTLLGLAREVAEEQGPEAINIRDIARRAGVATGTVYNYFSGKDELLLALTEDCWREALGELETAIPPGRVSDRLGEVFRLLRRQMDAPGGRLMGHLGGSGAAGPARMAAAQRQLAGIILGMLEEDREIPPDSWSPVLTREAVAGLLTRELVTLLRVRADSPALLVAVAERMLYK
ncbi:MAG: TetR/AcrR family transcriptional regulator [Angelakisella sp.]|jgi:AcrR family transcriptional regulator|nr:TetR/AcrR family transcriptional regulator [Angelakisella sp.]